MSPVWPCLSATHRRTPAPTPLGAERTFFSSPALQSRRWPLDGAPSCGLSPLGLVDALVACSNPLPAFKRLVEVPLEAGRARRPSPKRQAQVHLGDAARLELLERYLAGERASDLARALGLNRRTVADILRRAGVRARTHSPLKSERRPFGCMASAGPVPASASSWGVTLSRFDRCSSELVCGGGQPDGRGARRIRS